ncbi:hypothetical protein C5167_033418 [Papaver somniferum]|uniref:Peptidase M28 domain-containing protein n=1 Tax=Papaver somniferum TaxID=3469 RepID=A0A4Y7KD63_PAPSO|nr:hypothetical protein C5167_033418 [Papaver somniferum]
MGFKLSSRDLSGFKCLICLGFIYSIMSLLAYMIIHTKHIKPLEIDAPLDQFSEARAIQHVTVLSQQIDGRQEGRPGLMEAARYIKLELEKLAGRAGPDIRIEIEETVVAASMLEIARLTVDSSWVPPQPVILLFNGAEELFLLDIFPVIPGDTDYRILSEDSGDIPGLDIIFLLGGYFYHTSSDTVDRLMYALHMLFWYKF